MAMSDYRLCDACGGKAFYDAELDYDMGNLNPETFEPKLQMVSSMAVVCDKCEETHVAVVIEKSPSPANWEVK